MSLKYTALSNYSNTFYQFIASRERKFSALDFVPRDIGDKQVTIGAGINMTSGKSTNKFAVYRALGIVVNPDGTFDLTVGTAAQRTAEQGYVTLLNAVLSNPALTATQKAAELDKVMAARAADTALNGYADSRKATFAFDAGAAGEQQIRNSFDEASQAYDQGLQKLLNAYDPRICADPGFANSREHAALLSMYYNGEKTIGPSLMKALADGNHAEAWFEIRYNTNSSGQPANERGGLAKRRFLESQLFGLYGDHAAMTGDEIAQESKDIYRMFNAHKQKITGYENEFGLTGTSHDKNGNTPMQNAIAEAAASGVGQVYADIKAALQPAYDYLTSEYVTNKGIGITIDGDILAGQDSSVMGANIGGQDTLTGTANNDLIFGEGGKDIISGGEVMTLFMEARATATF